MVLWIVSLYFAFVVVIYFFPTANVPFTLRRGFFKFLPLLVFAVACTEGARRLSTWVDRWENGVSTRTAPTATRTAKPARR